MADGTIRIHDIQGAAQTSPLVGQTVSTVPGIVTAVRSNGFYLQDPNPDESVATSEGIFVFTRSAPTVSVGNSILVSGTVSEFTPGGADTGNLSVTQITSPTIQPTTDIGSISPTIIGADGRTPPTQVIDNDNLTSFDPTQDSIDFYESLEGMQVQVNDAVAVSPTNSFGEIWTLANGGANATGVNPREGITIRPDDFNPERIQIDDTLLSGSSPAVNVGDQLGTVTGVVDYSFGNYEVLPSEDLTVTPDRLVREVTSLNSTSDQLTVASFNVENLDPTIEERALVQGRDDIDDDIGSGKFAAIANQIVENLRSPDVIGLQEIQDNDGAEQTDVVDASLTYQTLIDAIVEAGGPRYEFTDIPPQDDQSGGQPGGNIRVGYLYNPDRVDLLDTQKLTDTNLSDGNAFEDSRNPLVAEFLFNGNEVTLVNNHFTSKGGSSPLFGQIQPPTNRGEEQREAQAQIVNSYVEQLLAENPNANVGVLGDLNEFQFFPPIEVLEGDELNNLTETLPPTQQYSYIFQGNSQALDHILVSDNLLPTAEYDPVHVNAEFVEQASDHDPVLSRFSLDLPEGVINGTPSSDPLNGNNGKDTIYGRGGDDNVSGGNGMDALFGLAGDDCLAGGNGKDLLNGGAGNDTLVGGNGSDRFVLTASGGTNTISDFKDSQDLIQLSGITFEQLTITQGTDDNSNDTLISLASNDELLAILSGVQSSTITAADFVA